MIFDCDGTLVDTEPLQNLAAAQLLAEEGMPQYDSATITRRFVGTKLSAMLRVITAETGHVFPGTMSARYVERVRALSPVHFRRVPEIETLVAAAAAHGKICVASNGQRDNVTDSLRLAGLVGYFPEAQIFTAVQVANPKPAPDLFVFAARQMNVSPARCVVLEDSVVGVAAGAAAAMRVIGFTGTHHDPHAHARALRAAGAHETAADISAVKRLVFGV